MSWALCWLELDDFCSFFLSVFATFSTSFIQATQLPFLQLIIQNAEERFQKQQLDCPISERVHQVRALN